MVLCFGFKIDGIVVGQFCFFPANQLVGGGSCGLEQLGQQPTDWVGSIGHADLGESPRALGANLLGELPKMTTRYMKAEISIGVIDVEFNGQGLLVVIDLGNGEVDPGGLKAGHLGKDMRAFGDTFPTDVDILQ